MIFTVGGIDPSLTNFGLVRMGLNLDDLSLTLTAMKLITTAPGTIKQVRRNSDDIVRCRALHDGYHEFLKPCAVAFTEVPVGAQSARAALSNGACYGLLASCPIPLIEVQPSETKMATVGTKTASKEEMIEWAVETYPDAPWLRHKKKGVMVLTNANEHMADAVGVIHAGIRTDEFKRFLAMWRAQLSQVIAA